MRYFLEIEEEVPGSEISQPTVIQFPCPSADELIELLRWSHRVFVETPDERTQVIDRKSFTLDDLAVLSRVDGASLIFETEQTELTQRLVGDLSRWPENLFRRVDEVNWGSDGVATRLRNSLPHYGYVQFVAQAMLIYPQSGVRAYWIPVSAMTHTHVSRATDTDQDPNTVHRQVRNYGAKCHERLREVIRSMGIDPDMDMTDFPWELLGHR